MEILQPLGRTGREVRDICLPGMAAGERKDRLTADGPVIDADENKLRMAFRTGSAHSLVVADFSDQVRADMKWLYEKRLRDQDPGRQVWLEIVGLAGRRCPFCHLSKPRTVEHSFPQSTHPRLATEPLNLVPACRDCNFERNVGSGHITVSPYIDDWVVQLPWLQATVLDPRKPEDLSFAAVRHASMSDEQWTALSQFVKDVHLTERYVTPAIEALEEFAEGLRLYTPNPRLTDVRDALEDRVRAARAVFGLNRWQPAAYSAWLRFAAYIDWSTAGRPT